jgi:hypothetical protein
MAEIIPFKCRFNGRRYQYKGFWVEIFIEENGYQAYVELPHQGGVISSKVLPNLDQVEFAVEELIDSWN